MRTLAILLFITINAYIATSSDEVEDFNVELAERGFSKFWFLLKICKKADVPFPQCGRREKTFVFDTSCDNVNAGITKGKQSSENVNKLILSFSSIGNNTVSSVCPGPTTVSGCIACVSKSRPNWELVVGNSTNVDFTFNCKQYGYGLFGYQVVDFRNSECKEGEVPAPTTKLPTTTVPTTEDPIMSSTMIP